MVANIWVGLFIVWLLIFFINLFGGLSANDRGEMHGPITAVIVSVGVIIVGVGLYFNF